MTITASTTSTTVSIPTGQLIEALKFVIPAMSPTKDMIGLDVVWVSSGPVWAGWSKDWEPQWGKQGITFATTDRYRLHVVGIECEVPDFPTISMRGAQVATALKAAPKPARNGHVVPSELRIHGPSMAELAWGFGATLPIDLTGRDMPGIKPLLTLKGDTPDATTGFTPKYLSEALMAFHQVKGGRPIRMRTSHNGKPAAVASADLEDSRSAIIMPVRLPA